ASATCTSTTVLASLNADANGAFSTTVTIPQSATLARNYAIGAIGSDKGGFFGGDNAAKAPAFGFATNAPAWCDVNGAWARASTAVTIKWDCTSATCASTTVLATPTTDANGAFTQTVTIPVTATDNHGFTIGAYESGVTTSFAGANITVKSTLVITPTSGPPG